jgi:hypothetical protein
MNSQISVIEKKNQFPQVIKLHLFVFTSELGISMLKYYSLCKLSINEKLCVILDLLRYATSVKVISLTEYETTWHLNKTLWFVSDDNEPLELDM